MARRPLDKEQSEANIGNPGLVKAAMVRITTEGKVDTDTQFAKFLLNPSSWQENKSVNWASHNVPGQSDPVKQFVSGGPRTISFEALVTKDTNDLGKGGTSIASGLINKGINAVSSIASNFFNVSVPPLQDLFSNFSSGGEANPLDISGYLDYYRACAYPTYSDNGEFLKSPPLLVLYVGTSFQNQNSEVTDSLKPEGHVWVLKSYSINITKQLPNLAPMEAVVSFQLEQYITNSVSSPAFHPNAIGIGNSLESPASLGDFFNTY